MIETDKICKGCMKPAAVDGKCSECGFDEAAYNTPPHNLKPGTILAGKYMLGKKLGEGGFGITYIGIDLNLGLRVAIKEYFPSGCVTRNTEAADTITVFDGNARDFFERGRGKFIGEAQTIAQLNDTEGVVSVKDFFLENGTAYIVMEYLNGETLKEYLDRSGGKISAVDALNMIKPVLGALIQLHKSGLIHRDISPDNIMITKTGKIKLIDFGAARDINPQGNRSLSIQLKPGYAPEEQYRTHGEQGSWTDVYALCATIYRMITGTVPEESNERLVNDTLAAPSALGVKINADIEAALMRGLNVRARDRIQSISELYDVFYGNGSAPDFNKTDNPEAVISKTEKRMKIAVILLTAAVIIAAVIIFILLQNKNTNSDKNLYDNGHESVSDTDLNGGSDESAKSGTSIEPGITMKQYNAIEMGMSVDEVVQLMGQKGDKISDDTSEQYGFVSYEWRRDNISYIIASFSYEKVSSKSQYGLDDSFTEHHTGNMTMDKYSKIRTDMSLEEVEAITGEKGMLTYSDESSGYTYKDYRWSGSSEFSYADIGFENEKVTSMSQNMLK